ncbi:MAG TPA: hypothetical protein VNZ26_09980, partial [Vicinamibacterales bacterium]|nr:hypothetical protein [Vicinamibacterales bacterium]
GPKNVTHVSSSVVGSIATGDKARAHGWVSKQGPLNQDEYLHIIKDAQMALVHDQETLDRIDGSLYEGLNQMLRLLRNVQIEQADLTRQLATMKGTVDDIWASKTAESLRGHLLPHGLAVLEALATHVVTGVIVEQLQGR